MLLVLPNETVNNTIKNRFWWRHINAYDTMQFSYCKRFCKICLTLSQVSRSFPEKDKKEIKDIIRPQTGSNL